MDFPRRPRPRHVPYRLGEAPGFVLNPPLPTDDITGPRRVYMLSRNYNYYLVTYHRHFSNNLKLAKVIRLFKKGDPTSVTNYRPIYLLLALSKIFERVIYNQIHNYFTLNNFYYEGQYGFRNKHSTELAALNIIDTITSLMENGDIPITIYLDYLKHLIH